MATAEATETTGLVEVRVVDVRRRPAEGERPNFVAVVLEEVAGPRRLPIWVGDFEGTAIALHLERVDLPRPLTYVFTASLLQAAGGRLREVRIERLVDEAFYAVAVVDGPQGTREVDARPSDALNLALLAGAPIRVAPDVLETTAGEDANAERAQETLVSEGTEGTAEIVAGMRAGWPSRTSSTAEEEGAA